MLDPESVAKFRKAAQDDKAVFVFIPSTRLREKIMANDDPVLSSLPPGMAEVILACPNDSGIRLDADLVIRHLTGKTDAANSYLLSLGEIRVLGSGDMVIQTPPPSADPTETPSPKKQAKKQ